MFKYKYAITYKCRPNKKSEGATCALNITTGSKLENLNEQRKVLLMLSKVHRVNPNAIELGHFHLLKREFAPLKWVKDKFVGAFKRNLNAVRVR